MVNLVDSKVKFGSHLLVPIPKIDNSTAANSFPRPKTQKNRPKTDHIFVKKQTKNRLLVSKYRPKSIFYHRSEPQWRYFPRETGYRCYIVFRVTRLPWMIKPEYSTQVNYINYSSPKLKFGLIQRQLGCLNFNGHLKTRLGWW